MASNQWLVINAVNKWRVINRAHKHYWDEAGHEGPAFIFLLRASLRSVKCPLKHALSLSQKMQDR
jgi:hypothetical protein